MHVEGHNKGYSLQKNACESYIFCAADHLAKFSVLVHY